MAKNISLLGADYPDVPAVDLPKTGGGTARFVDADDIPVIKTNSFTGTTSGSGNVSKSHAKKVIILSAWTDGADRIVAPFPGSGAGISGQYTWWFQVFVDNSSHSVVSNESVTIYYAYIEI